MARTTALKRSSRESDGSDLDWPTARVQLPWLMQSAALGALGAGLTALSIHRGNAFAAFGGLMIVASALIRFQWPNLAFAPVQDAPVSVRDGTLRVNGKPVDVSRVLRRNGKDGPVVVVEARRHGNVDIICASTDHEKALLAALGESGAPHAFSFIARVPRIAMSVGLGLAFVCGVGAALHLGPEWRWLWLLSVLQLVATVRARLEITKDELVVRDLSLRRHPLRDLSGARADPSRAGGASIRLMVDSMQFDILGPLGEANKAATLLDKRIRRAKANR
ncbi:hypothetical protein BH09MYX1_BH09MYX1_18430 [soil metagenome]